MTLRGREVAEGDEFHSERFLLYSGQGGRLHVFCAATEVAVLHQTEYIVCDGTIEMSPSTSYQLYTIHGFKDGEGLPLAWGLLPNKTTDTYREVFSSLRQALTTSFGDIGQVKYVLMDYERAAINAVTEVFPEVQVKGCSFHFRQALMRKVHQVGLKNVYEEGSRYPSARTWLYTYDHGYVHAAGICSSDSLERLEEPTTHWECSGRQQTAGVRLVLWSHLGSWRFPTSAVECGPTTTTLVLAPRISLKVITTASTAALVCRIRL